VALSVFLVGNLSLCGLPFITGFFSKDLILELIMISRVNVILFLAASGPERLIRIRIQPGQKDPYPHTTRFRINIVTRDVKIFVNIEPS
jgi:formate hydrogenlyase subunit 3/multisubunit Na+/H+ antiporter MnhD subunit